MGSSIEVTIKETEPTMAAFIEMKGPYTQMPDAFCQLYGWIGQKGYVPSGPPSGVYFSMPGQVPEGEYHWEVRSPIAGDPQPLATDDHGIGVKRLEPTTVASTLHKGPFEQVGRTYEALAAWIAANGYEIAGPPQEVYLTPPGEVPPEDLVTEILFPVKR